MEDKITFSLADIKLLISKQIDELIKEHGDEIELKEDYYWTQSNNDIYKIYQDPEEPTLGSLVDDLKYIKRGYNEYFPSKFLIEKISILLKYISML